MSGQPGAGPNAGTSATTASTHRRRRRLVDDGPADADASGSAAVDADLDGLAPFAGTLVRVGGLVVDLRTDGFTLDDGTAVGRVVLRGAALELLPLIEVDDALNVIGRVETSTDGYVVAVEDPGAIILAGDPVAATGPIASQAVGAPGPSGGGDHSPDVTHRSEPVRRVSAALHGPSMPALRASGRSSRSRCCQWR